MPVQKTDETRVVQQALDLLRNKGYQRTSMSDVGKACGLLKGSLYHYFSSKEDMALAVLRYVDSQFQDTIFPIAYEDDLPPAKRLNKIADATAEYFLSRQDGCLMGNLALEAINTVPEFRPLIQHYFDDWIVAYAHIYKDGGLSPATARKKAQQSVAQIQGALMMMRIFEDSAHFRTTMKALSAQPT